MKAEMIINRVALAGIYNPEIIESIRKVGEISSACTGDNHMCVSVFLYDGFIRYEFEGTRSGYAFNIKADNTKIRKPRNSKPLMEGAHREDVWASEIIRKYEEIKKWM